MNVGLRVPEAARCNVQALALALCDADEAQDAEARNIEVLDPGFDKGSKSLAQSRARRGVVCAVLQVRLQHSVDNLSHLLCRELPVWQQLIRVGHAYIPCAVCRKTVDAAAKT